MLRSRIVALSWSACGIQVSCSQCQAMLWLLSWGETATRVRGDIGQVSDWTLLLFCYAYLGPRLPLLSAECCVSCTGRLCLRWRSLSLQFVTATARCASSELVMRRRVCPESDCLYLLVLRLQ